MNSILRLIVWVWSMGWLSCGASAFSNGDTARSWISVCCLAVGIGADELLGRRDRGPPRLGVPELPVAPYGTGAFLI